MGLRTAPRERERQAELAFRSAHAVLLHGRISPCDRPALERLVRYLLRPLISADRLTARPDGRVEYRFRRPDPSGRTSWVTDGATWCRRLQTLLPRAAATPPGFHGVLSSAHAWRSRVVRSPTVAPPASTSTPPPSSTMLMLARRLDWAALLRRVFGDEVTQCPRCGDALRVLAVITDPTVTADILDHLGLTTDPVPIAPARAPPDAPGYEFDVGT